MMMTKKEAQLFKAYMDKRGDDTAEREAWLSTERRNRLQRERRASPEAKAKEALASRRSYHKIKHDTVMGCLCPACVRERAKFNLNGVV